MTRGIIYCECKHDWPSGRTGTKCKQCDRIIRHAPFATPDMWESNKDHPHPPPTPQPTAPDILEQAADTVRDRHELYGDCTEVFAATNAMYEVYRGLKKGRSDAYDTAVFNIIQKIVRIGSGKPHVDNWRDIGGYAGTGAEVSE